MQREPHRPMQTRQAQPRSEEDERLALKLEAQGHSCIEWHGTLHWCEQPECEQNEQDRLMKQRNIEVKAEIARLRAAGHTCITEPDIYPAKFFWCEQTPCSQ